MEPASEDMGHILGIIASLFTHLPSDSASRIRVLAKFVEGDYEKVDKLLELRDNARKRLKITDAEVAKERQVRSIYHPSTISEDDKTLGDD